MKFHVLSLKVLRSSSLNSSKSASLLYFCKYDVTQIITTFYTYSFPFLMRRELRDQPVEIVNYIAMQRTSEAFAITSLGTPALAATSKA